MPTTLYISPATRRVRRTTALLLSLILLCSSSLLLGCNPGADSGRSGNKNYEEGLYDEATSTYQAGIDNILTKAEALEDNSILSGLQNNAGASLLRGEHYADARDMFVSSVTSSSVGSEKARGYYNAGVAAYNEDQKKLATEYFKKALLQEPANADAKYNYEYVARELKHENEDNQDQSGDEPPPPPSAYAKELKAQAEELVAQRRYSEAAQLMQDGLQVDPSVQAFKEFMDRIDSIIAINSVNT